MSLPKWEVLAGVVDGVNRVFTTSVTYVAGTFVFFLNGIAHQRTDDDGWTETSPLLGTVTLNEAPVPGDVVRGFYLDTSASEVVVSDVEGIIEDIDVLEGAVVIIQALDGEVSL